MLFNEKWFVSSMGGTTWHMLIVKTLENCHGWTFRIGLSSFKCCIFFASETNLLPNTCFPILHRYPLLILTIHAEAGITLCCLVIYRGPKVVFLLSQSSIGTVFPPVSHTWLCSIYYWTDLWRRKEGATYLWFRKKSPQNGLPQTSRETTKNKGTIMWIKNNYFCNEINR